MKKAMGLLVVLALTGAGIWWFALRQPPQSQTPQVNEPTQGVLAPAETQRLEKLLNSDNRAEQAKAMSPALASVYLAQKQPMLLEGARLKLKPETFVHSGNAAHVDADIVLSSSLKSTFTLVLISDQNGRWLLLNTEGE